MAARRAAVAAGLSLLAAPCAQALAGQGTEALAASSRQRALEDAWGAELEPRERLSPIQRVVNLLNKMKEELTGEAEKEAEMYDKMVCWCESNEKEKTKAVAEAEARDASLSAETQERAARFGELATTIEHLKVEIASNKEMLAQARAIREKDAAEFRGRETDMVETVSNLRNAIAVLSKHQGGGKEALLQVGASIMSGLQVLLHDVALKYELMRAGQNERRGAPAAALLQVAGRGEGVSLLSLLGQGTEHMTEVLPLDIAQHLIARAAAPSRRGGSGNFLQAGEAQPIFESRSSARSGQIFGVLNQMLDEFTAELSTTQKEELKAQEDFKAMSDAKVQQIETGKKKLDDFEVEHANNQKALSDAKEDLTLTRQQRSEDVKFLQNLKLQCNDLDDQWHKRSETRSNELKAVTETIAIITEDDAREAMSKAVSLLELRAASSAEAARRRAAAAAALSRAAAAPDFEADDLLAAWRHRSTPIVGAGPKAQLSALAVQVQLDGFAKVKEMMDRMTSELKAQQAEEVKFKADCTENMQTNEKTTYDKTELKKDLEARMQELEAQMTRLASEIDEHKKQIASAQLEIKKAGHQREVENSEFQLVVADQRATQTILKKALEKLKDFYEKKIGQTVLAQGAQEPPVKFNAFKTNAGSNSVIGLIEQILEDSVKLEKETSASESQAQVGYEDFVLQSNAVIKSLQEAVVEKSDSIAAAKTDSAQAASDHESAVAELESLEQYKADLHSQCNFILKNFDIRQRARMQEMEAIQSAKAILSGAASA